jgi:ABC-2 type transport system permease protein
MRIALAFLKKDFLTAISYRLNFILQVIFIALAVPLFYVIGRFVESGSIPLLEPYGGNYFEFLLIGIAFSHYTWVSINSFAGIIRDGQVTGTLEIVLSSPTNLPTILLSSSLWSYVFTSFHVMIYILVGFFLFDLEIAKANLLSVFVIFMISIAAFIALGVMFASVILVFKRGESAMNAIGGLLLLLGGMLFPPEVFPGFVGKLSVLSPFTYSLHGLRMSIIEGYSLALLVKDIVGLTVFAAVFGMMGVWLFPSALRKAKVDGTLTQY